jgi:hypothetical protein
MGYEQKKILMNSEFVLADIPIYHLKEIRLLNSAKIYYIKEVWIIFLWIPTRVMNNYFIDLPDMNMN